mgnify:FL=1|tara:strand:+ start:1475 stop:1831 length:357 start_codon:yes stop_codon:yes gene_type:complete
MKNISEKFVDVNGNQVMDLTPDMNRALALVDLDVLIKLTSYLGKSNVYQVKRDLLFSLREVSSDNGKESLQALVDIASEFVAFHNTVNLIQEINHPLNVTKHQLDDEPITGTNLNDLD